MALKATIYKAELMISDMDRDYYATHTLTIAQHPSETILRMMTRIAVFALNAHERLEFTRGISTEDEPDLWQRTYSDETELWIELGQPDEKRLRKACNKAQSVKLYGYQGNAFDVWWKQHENKIHAYPKLSVIKLADDACTQLEALCARTMRLQATIQDGTMWLGNDEKSIEFSPETLFSGDKS